MITSVRTKCKHQHQTNERQCYITCPDRSKVTGELCVSMDIVTARRGSMAGFLFGGNRYRLLETATLRLRNHISQQAIIPKSGQRHAFNRLSAAIAHLD